MKKTNNGVNVILPEEEVNKTDVQVVINMADIMQQYQNGLKNSIEYGISIGQELARSGNKQIGNCVPQIESGASAMQSPSFIAIADKFSYGAYSNPDSFEKAKTFYHSPTSVVSNFDSFNEALEWAYNECCNMNPGKNIPFNNKRNWRTRINSSETEGED